MYEPENDTVGARMRKLLFFGLILALLVTAGAGCSRSTGGGEARYLTLFNTAWAACHELGLYEATVESVAYRPDGNRMVVVSYLFDNGMVPDSGRAAMLVGPDGSLASQCVVDLAVDTCLCGATRDWHEAP